MPLRYRSIPTQVTKAGPKRVKATPARVKALREQMSKVVSTGIAGGIRKLQSSVDPMALLKAFESKNYKTVMDYIPGKSVDKLFDGMASGLEQAAVGSSKITRGGLPAKISEKLRYDYKNPNISKYVNTRIGALIQNVDDETQINVGSIIRRRLEDGLSMSDARAEIADRLRGGIGLNARQQTALANFDGDEDATAAYKEMLINQRADMIGRTETSYAMNQGQLDVWQAAQDQDLIPENATKKWVVDGKPCPFICEPMDGVEVSLDEDFQLPDGVTVPGPPAHPNCYCQMQIGGLGDNPSSGRENYKIPYDNADSGLQDGDLED